MRAVAAAAALRLIVLHTVDGREIDVNPVQVTSMRETTDEASTTAKPFTDKVRCMVSLADGKFVSVIEECKTVRNMIEAAER